MCAVRSIVHVVVVVAAIHILKLLLVNLYHLSKHVITTHQNNFIITTLSKRPLSLAPWIIVVQMVLSFLMCTAVPRPHLAIETIVRMGSMFAC